MLILVRPHVERRFQSALPGALQEPSALPLIWRIDQVGDMEVGTAVPVEQIDEVLKLIRVSKVANRNPGGNPESLRTPVSERVRDAESSERQRVV